MDTYYVIDANITKETMEQLTAEGENFITLQSVKADILQYREEELVVLIEALEISGRLDIKEDGLFNERFVDDRLIALCKQLQTDKNRIELLTNDLLVHLKAQSNGINAIIA